jgi:hypothetical protein
MFIKKWKWRLSGKNQRVSIRVFGLDMGNPLSFQAILDTGSSNCVFSQDDFHVLFSGQKIGKPEPVRGIGDAQEISRLVSIELLSENGELIRKLTNVSASFILDRIGIDAETGEEKIIPFDEAIFGIANAMDQFKWTLDYPGATMTLTE